MSIVVIAGLSLLPPLTSRGLFVCALLMLVVLPYNMAVRQSLVRHGRAPAVMAWGGQVLVAGFIAVWPEVLGPAMAIGILDVAIAAVILDRRTAVRGACVGGVVIGLAVGLELLRTPGELAETYVASVGAYALCAVTTAYTVGTVASHERSARGQLSALLGSLEVVVYEIDAETLQVRYVSPYIERLTGALATDYLGDPDAFLGLVHRRDVPMLLSMVSDLNDGRRTHDLEYRVFTGTGELRWVRNIATTDVDPEGRSLIRGTLTDITAQKMAELALASQARTDALTGLPNRAQLLEAVAASASGRDRQVLVFLDLDVFKRINDSLGHKAGDDLLTQVAGRLSSAVRGSDVVSRIGGDEFVVLSRVAEEEDAQTVVARLVAAFAEPFPLHGRSVSVTASAGAVHLPPGCPDRADSLLEQADLAMYSAKRSGPGHHAFYAPEMRSGALEQLDVETAIRAALEQQQFHVVYQPVLRAGDRVVVGHEALVRWDHPVRGLVSPVEFIPLAERTGQIVDLGRWVLFEACRQARRWLDEGEPARSMSVNLSALQLNDPGLVDDVASALQAARLPASSLCLEITETALIANPEQALTTLRALRASGTVIALDDFGTGFSSLSHLHRYPVDVVKIDRSFVVGVGNGADRGIVTAILHLAHHMGLTVVAEGMETLELADVLSGLECDLLQGYALGRPARAVPRALETSPQLQPVTAAPDLVGRLR